MPSTNSSVTQYDAENGQAQFKGLEAINQALAAVTNAKAKVDAKVEESNGEIQKLQEKAAAVDSCNQGKMKKLQRKSRFLMDKLNHLGHLHSQLDRMTGVLERRKRDYLTAYEIGNRAEVIDGELHLLNETDAFMMNIISMRRQTEAFDLERTDMLLKALPKEFRD